MKSVMSLYVNHQQGNQRSFKSLGGGASFHRMYKRLDELLIAVGALHRHSITALLKMTDLSDEFNSVIEDQARWKVLEGMPEALFKTRHRDDCTLSPRGIYNLCVTCLNNGTATPSKSGTQGLHAPREGKNTVSGPKVLQDAGYSIDDMEYVQSNKSYAKCLAGSAHAFVR